MACNILPILSWENKLETIKVFLTVNLVFYLLVLGGYSLISLLSSVLIILVVVINTHSLIHKTKFEDDKFEYISKDQLERLFVFVFNSYHSLKSAFESTERLVQGIFSLYLFNFWAQVFGPTFLLWVMTDLAFVLTPQYCKNRSAVDSHLSSIRQKLDETKSLLNELIPKHQRSH